METVQREQAAATQQGIQQGREQCQNDPASCGLYSLETVQAEQNAAYEAGMTDAKTACKNDPVTCLTDIPGLSLSAPLTEEEKSACGDTPCIRFGSDGIFRVYLPKLNIVAIDSTANPTTPVDPSLVPIQLHGVEGNFTPPSGDAPYVLFLEFPVQQQ